MSLFKKIKSSFSCISGKNILPDRIDTYELSMNQSDNKVYSEDKLILQKLYEKWSCRDKWLLFDEGIPLLFGLEPGKKQSIDEELSEKVRDLCTHARDCVKKKLLSVVSIEKPEERWEVRPVDLYYWATVSRIAMPEEFSTLMAFIVQAVKPTELNTNSFQDDVQQDTIYQKHREIVLGAATSLLVNAPELCKDNKGNIESDRITKKILENKNQRFGNVEPLLAESAMADLINGYLKLIRPVV